MATKWGTHHIGVKQAQRAFHAVRYASEIGRPLNLMVTVHLSALDIAPEEAGRVFQQLWSRVGRWWAYQRGAKSRPLGPFDCLALHEHPREKGRHAHWVLRVPDDARDRLTLATSTWRRAIRASSTAADLRSAGASGPRRGRRLAGSAPDAKAITRDVTRARARQSKPTENCRGVGETLASKG